MHQEGRCQPPFAAQVFDECRQFARLNCADHRHRRDLLGLMDDTLHPLFADQRLHQPESDKRPPDMLHQAVAGIGRQIVALQQNGAHAAIMAVALGDTLQRATSEFHVGIVEQHGDFHRLADFDDRRSDTARQLRPGGDQCPVGGRSAPDQVDEIVIGKRRRVDEDGGGNFRLVFGKRQHDGARRGRTGAQGFGQSQPHHRRWIVEQVIQGHGRRVAFTRRDALHQESPCQSPGGTRPVGGFRPFNPAKKCLNDHRDLEDCV